MKIAIVTLDGFNEIDSFVALSILSRVKVDGWSVQITAPEKSVTSMNGVEIKARQKLSFANEADVVLFGSGTHTRDHIDNADLIAQFALDPTRQLIGAQCSGALFLHRLGFLPVTAATDAKTRPLLAATGCLIEDKPLIAQGNIVTAGGCLSSQYLAGWVIARALGLDHALAILEHVAPSGQKSSFVKTAADIIKPQLNVPTQPALYC
jgi:transcriptional regulator GlxA family with amidase domain